MIPYFNEPRIIQNKKKYSVCFRNEVITYGEFDQAYLKYKEIKHIFGFERMVQEHFFYATT